MDINLKSQDEFEEWGRQKFGININTKRFYFREREVWWCYCGKNIGNEQNGKGDKYLRPILVFKKFNNEVLWAIPLTSRIKKGKFYQEVFLADGMSRSVILSQLKLIDAKRLSYKLGTISNDNHSCIKKAVIRLCDE